MNYPKYTPLDIPAEAYLADKQTEHPNVRYSLFKTDRLLKDINDFLETETHYYH